MFHRLCSTPTSTWKIARNSSFHDSFFGAPPAGGKRGRLGLPGTGRDQNSYTSGCCTFIYGLHP
eukprot:8846542-Pyramimonas_sp.AAC.1